MSKFFDWIMENPIVNGGIIAIIFGFFTWAAWTWLGLDELIQKIMSDPLLLMGTFALVLLIIILFLVTQKTAIPRRDPGEVLDKVLATSFWLETMRGIDPEELDKQQISISTHENRIEYVILSPDTSLRGYLYVEYDRTKEWVIGDLINKPTRDERRRLLGYPVLVFPSGKKKSDPVVFGKDGRPIELPGADAS